MKQATRQKYRKSMQYIKQLDEKIKTESEMLNILKKELINITIDEVCETYNVKFGWNGKIADYNAADGIYSYQIKFLNKKTKENQLLQGHVNLLR